ncbi:hypothetical protein [Haloferula sargassicola]|uniref:Uncharacterized protein n=1 Tax=Haloferula sargassicola TaxID=490096 RepID=A0ABP9UTU3_9BACT
MPHIQLTTDDGTLKRLSITPELLSAHPDLKAALDRVSKATAGTTLATYGESYERGGGHDKEHDKSGDHGKEFSRTA